MFFSFYIRVLERRMQGMTMADAARATKREFNRLYRAQQQRRALDDGMLDLGGEA